MMSISAGRADRRTSIVDLHLIDRAPHPGFCFHSAVADRDRCRCGLMPSPEIRSDPVLGAVADGQRGRRASGLPRVFVLLSGNQR